MKMLIPIVALVPLLGSVRPAEAGFGDFVKKAGGAAINVATAPIRAPIVVVQKVGHGEPVTVTDVVKVAVPGAAQLDAAAQSGVPGAAVVKNVVELPVTVVETITNLRDRTEQLEGVLDNANTTMEQIRDAAIAVENAANAGTATAVDADETIKMGRDLILSATTLLKTIDLTAPNSLETIKQLRAILETGQKMLGTGPRIKPVVPQPASAAHK